MNFYKILFLLNLISFLSFGQSELEENNKKLFSWINSDTLYRNAQNRIYLNLEDFSEKKYYYKCEGAMVTQEGLNLLSLNPTSSNLLLKVYTLDPKDPKGDNLLIGQKNLYSTQVPK